MVYVRPAAELLKRTTTTTASRARCVGSVVCTISHCIVREVRVHPLDIGGGYVVTHGWGMTFALTQTFRYGFETSDRFHPLVLAVYAMSTLTKSELEKAIAFIWERPPWLRAAERVEFSVKVALHDSLVVYGQRYLVGRYGEAMSVGWRSARVELSGRLLRTVGSTSRVVDMLTDTLQYLVSVVCPRPPPKGWRLYGRMKPCATKKDFARFTSASDVARPGLHNAAP